MGEAKLILGCLERVLDGPALPFDGNQGLDRGPGRAPGGEVGTLAIAEAASDQQAACPAPRCAATVFRRVEVSQFEVGPVIEARPLGALARGQALPGSGLETLGNLLGGAGH